MGTSAGRTSRPFRRARAAVLNDSTTCIVCGHPNADSVDHIIARSRAPDLANDQDNLAPCHHLPCPTCGRRCNREKGTRPLDALKTLKTSEPW